ncbi:hypothetical protein BC829DRAFT_440269 [Chytridium lagenaria]|nr:hypothetical protein BC829DRAFT_440269 [Chytridium lagenaria]
MIKNSGSRLSRLVGGHHDVISFDPRGIGESHPVICFNRASEHALYDRESNTFDAPGFPGSLVTLKEFAARKTPWVLITQYVPDRVGRFIIDGVIDPELYVSTYVEDSRGTVIHTDEVLEAFGLECEKADQNVSTVSAVIKAFLESLVDVPIPAPTALTPGVLTRKIVASILLGTTYSPLRWSPIASALLKPYQQDGSGSSGNPAVKCNDGADESKGSLDEFLRGAEEYWPVKAAERFTGPWNKTLKNKILIIGNTLDPVTPIEGAKAVFRLSTPANSVLLVQEGIGHCSTAQPSLCTLAVIENLFVNGTLPEQGTRCISEDLLFPPQGLNVENGKVKDAMAVADFTHGVLGMGRGPEAAAKIFNTSILMDPASKLLSEDSVFAEDACECGRGSNTVCSSRIHFHSTSPEQRPLKVAYVSLLAIALMACLGLKFRGVRSNDGWGVAEENYGPTFEKEYETPFQWETCNGFDPTAKFECGTLMSPLNYLDVNDTRQIPVRVIRYRAQKEPVLGSIFINPGGPGGSGLSMVKGAGPQISRLAGGQYDIHNAFDRMNGDYSVPGAPGSRISLNEFAAWKSVLGAGCKQYSGEFLDYVSTAFTARDMDFIREILKRSTTVEINCKCRFLGMTYANMFPDRVGRYIIDGVTDPVSFAGKFLDWSRSSLLHADQVFDAFGQECENAGSTRCPLVDVAASPAIIAKYNLNATRSASSTPSTISTLLRNYLEDLAENPLPAPNAVFPGVLTVTTAAGILFQATYSPIRWPLIADAFAKSLSTGDPAAIVDFANSGGSPDDFLCPLYDGSGSNGFPAEWEKTAQEVEKISFLAGRGWTYMGLTCKYWQSRPVERYTGPWNKTMKNKVNSRPGEHPGPSHPLESAKMVVKFLGPANSVLLVQDGLGHCSLAQPSLCTLNVTLNLFANGVLPDKETRCVSDYVLFPPEGGNLMAAGNGVSGMEALMRGMDALKVAEEVHKVVTGPKRVLGDRGF